MSLISAIVLSLLVAWGTEPDRTVRPLDIPVASVEQCQEIADILTAYPLNATLALTVILSEQTGGQVVTMLQIQPCQPRLTLDLSGDTPEQEAQDGKETGQDAVSK